jgi:hypothetical protein
LNLNVTVQWCILEMDVKFHAFQTLVLGNE